MLLREETPRKGEMKVLEGRDLFIRLRSQTRWIRIGIQNFIRSVTSKEEESHLPLSLKGRAKGNDGPFIFLLYLFNAFKCPACVKCLD